MIRRPRTTFTPAKPVLTPDPKLELQSIQGLVKVVREHQRAIAELQRVAVSQGRLIEGVQLVPGVDTVISHGMGRRVHVFMSPPRDTLQTGWVAERRLDLVDPKTHVALRAYGWVSSPFIVVDLWVF